MTSTSGGSLSQTTFSSHGSTIRMFAGSGSSVVTVKLDAPARLIWSNARGKSFRLSGAGAQIASSAGGGEARLPAGKQRIDVRGTLWTIVIRP